MTDRYFLILFLLIPLPLLISCSSSSEKIFVANEEDGSITVIDAKQFNEIDRIDLSEMHGKEMVKFLPHNIQSAGSNILVTANPVHIEQPKNTDTHEGGHQNHMDFTPTNGWEIIPAVSAHEGEKEQYDQLIVLDARTHKILNRINIGVGMHLAHVVSQDQVAFVTATEKDALLRIDLKTNSVKKIDLPSGSKPHGLRLTKDAKTAIIAGMGKSLVFVDLNDSQVTSISLPGKGVQVGIGDTVAMVSIYDTKQVGVYDFLTKELNFIDLPEAKGPIQLFPSPDSRFMYVADQGVYFNQAPGLSVYKIDISSKKVVSRIPTGDAPHGVVVSPDGKVWVSNLNGNTVSVLENDQKIKEITVGKSPNGITYWKES